MSACCEHFLVGDIRCTAINDGTFAYPADWLFSNVPKEELASKLREHDLPPDQVTTPYTCLLVRTGRETLLVDTGAGGFAPTTGHLLKNLAAEGVRPEDVTTVVLTHAHPDHIGGVLDANGTPAFPNARYVMSQAEWNFWTSDADLRGAGVNSQMKEMLSACARRNLPPLKSCLELIHGATDIVPGVEAIPTAGHTPGHLALLVSSGADQLMYIADAVLHPMHLEYPSWRNAFDLDEAVATSTRKQLLDRVAADDMNVLGYHFPFPSLGRIRQSGNAWRWEALNGEGAESSDVA